MPYASDRDRFPELLELEQTNWPAPPLNLSLTGGFMRGVYDLTWSNSAGLSLNSRFRLLGYNIYRSSDSEFGPFERITDAPVGSSYYRDQTDNVVEFEEEVSDSCWVLRGDASGGTFGPRYVFNTLRRPIVKSGSQSVLANSPEDVQVFVDGVPAIVKHIDGQSGEIELDPSDYVDVARQLRVPAVLPGESSRVTVTYRYTRSFLRMDLAQRVFYRITAVGVPLDPEACQDLVETPLEYAPSASNYETEKLDYIWREATRRNAWILAQGGERVRVSIRKEVGEQCPCYRARDYKQPINDCPKCFGVGIVGGYEGPFDILIAPDDGDRMVRQTQYGKTLDHTYEVWTSYRPILSQRDFITKLNGERYSVGGVRFPSNRGMVLQQHFNIGHIDDSDIRYKVPLDDGRAFLANVIRPPTPYQHGPSQVTDKPGIPDERELRGLTETWENITY